MFNAPLSMQVASRAVYAVLGALVTILFLSRCGDDSKNRGEILMTVSRLKAAGWAPATGEAPTIKDRPRGARPVAVVHGAARYPALEPGKAPAVSVSAVPPSGDPTAGADPLDASGGQDCLTQDVLRQVAVDVRCRAELIELDSVPAARLWVAGRLELDGAVRELPEQRVEDVRLDMAPIQRPRRFGWTVGVGGGYDPISKDARVVVGAMWGVRVR